MTMAGQVMLAATIASSGKGPVARSPTMRCCSLWHVGTMKLTAIGAIGPGLKR